MTAPASSESLTRTRRRLQGLCGMAGAIKPDTTPLHPAFLDFDRHRARWCSLGGIHAVLCGGIV